MIGIDEKPRVMPVVHVSTAASQDFDQIWL